MVDTEMYYPDPPSRRDLSQLLGVPPATASSGQLLRVPLSCVHITSPRAHPPQGSPNPMADHCQGRKV